tara:strand:- start:711 stop:1046 length:336 start_codon:yes stop_codon:yes gene_type:complete
MRRIPDEQFFDLRNWKADKAEDYGEKASTLIHTILLSKSSQVNRITSELHDGNIILIDFTPLISDHETLHKILAELERAIADIDGDLVGVSEKWILATPNGIRVSREKLKD